MIEELNIPAGWEEVTIEKVSVGIDKTNRKLENPEETFFYIDINAIDNQKYQIVQPKTYRWGNAPSRAQQIIQTNDIVFSTVRPYLKNIALVPEIYN